MAWRGIIVASEMTEMVGFPNDLDVQGEEDCGI